MNTALQYYSLYIVVQADRGRQPEEAVRPAGNLEIIAGGSEETPRGRAPHHPPTATSSGAGQAHERLGYPTAISLDEHCGLS